jgi:hypothetical protein
VGVGCCSNFPSTAAHGRHFISYKRADLHKVAPIVALLESRGWRVWWDTRIEAGETWDEVIERELEAASCVVAVWSVNSVGSRWVRAEASEGLERGILIPVHIDVTRPPLEFKLINAIDFSDWRGDPGATCAQGFTAAISKLLGPAPSQKTRDQSPPFAVEEVGEALTSFPGENADRWGGKLKEQDTGAKQSEKSPRANWIAQYVHAIVAGRELLISAGRSIGLVAVIIGSILAGESCCG